MKVALVVPNFRWVDGDKNALWHYLPYNLCLIAACVRDIAEVKIIDAYKEDMDIGSLTKLLGEFAPDVVGITVLMDKYGAAGHMVAEAAKVVNKEIMVVMGGVYASMNAERVADDENVDYVVKGEGEYVFRELLLFPEIYDGKIVEADRIKDLDVLPRPAYDLIDFHKYAVSAERKSVDAPRKYPYGRVLTSRGCPYHCSFCQVEHISGRQFRARSADSVLEEISWLKETYKIESLIFDDDNLLTDRKRAEEIFQGMIDRGLVMPWVMIATAAFRLDNELIKLMKQSGCVYVNVAIESGTERVLHKIIGKPIDLYQARLVVRQLQHEGIYVAANFIIGFPTETWDEIRATLAFAEALDADYTKIFAAMPLRNTRLWELCEKEKAFKPGFEGTVEWSDGQIETKDFSARDLTILRAYEWDRLNFTDELKRIKTCGMMGVSEEELLKIRRDTLRKVSERIWASYLMPQS